MLPPRRAEEQPASASAEARDAASATTERFII